MELEDKTKLMFHGKSLIYHTVWGKAVTVFAGLSQFKIEELEVVV